MSPPAADFAEAARRGGGAVDPARLIEQATWLLYLDSSRAGELGQQVLDATADQPDLPLRGDAHFHVGYALLRRSDVGPALAANELARTSFQRHGDDRGLLMCDEFTALHLRSQGRAQESLELQLRIAERTDVVRQPTDVYITHNSRALTRRLLGQHEQVLLDLYQAYAAAQACASPGPALAAVINLGCTHCDLYNLPEARRLLEQGLDMAEAAGAWHAFTVALFALTQAYDGLGLAQECADVLERRRRHEANVPDSSLRQNTPYMAVAHLCAGDLDGARDWLELGPNALFAEGDGKTDFARARAFYLMALGRDGEARAVAEERIAEWPTSGLQDQPYARMRLLQAATAACERLCDSAAALRYLHQSHELYETLVGRSSRAGFIAAQAAHEYAAARSDRDRARAAQEQAEQDQRRLAALNDVLEDRMRETQRLNDALQRKIAEAEALQDQLREQAVRDPLTGLYNRRFLAETSLARIELARRQRTSLAIVLIDIDHFKQINDEYGHERGDAVLRRFAALLGERMRRSDVICRFGGEEFLLLVDNCETATLHGVLDQLMAQFRALRFGAAGQSFAGRTFSAGVAVLGADGGDFESLVRVADERMYRAKATGRARICETSD